MNNGETSRFVRLHIELVMEVTDADLLTTAALDHVAADPSLPDDGRHQAQEAVREDPAEALAHLVDPSDLVTAVPGTTLAQASWSCEERADYDPDAAWDADEWELASDVVPVEEEV
ncbi:hypothetical protein [Streptomyces catenulae]|uniref:Uncharacterized protein n=1 Tax=Streptomyces catenulae TaxID=66875 RepID=A0ABV2YTT2_9ACTN|nr:hypothetical protein [Streptomyces catenulae]